MVRTSRGTFYVTDMSWEQMEADGYRLHHESDDGKYLVMGNGSRAFAIRNEEVQEHTAPEKKPSIRERLEDAKRECVERKSPSKPAPQKKPPELGDL